MEEEGVSKRNIPLWEAMSIYSTSHTSELPKLQQELPWAGVRQTRAQAQHGFLRAQGRGLLICVSCSAVSNSLWSHWLYSPPESSVLGILQPRKLDWVAIPFSREYSQTRDWTQGLQPCRQMLYHLQFPGLTVAALIPQAALLLPGMQRFSAWAEFEQSRVSPLGRKFRYDVLGKEKPYSHLKKKKSA